MKKLLTLLLALGMCVGTATMLSSCNYPLLVPDDTISSSEPDSSSEEEIDTRPSATTENELVTALQAGGEIVLKADIELSTTIEIPKGIVSTLDLNGYTLTTSLKEIGRHHYAIDNYGIFTLKGEGIVSARGIENFGTMVVEEGVTIESIDANGGAAIWNEGTLVINGGTFKALHEGSANDSYGPACLNNQNGGDVVINGGTFTSNNYRAYAIVSQGEILINDATVWGNQGALAIESGNATINSGSFTSTQHYGLYVDSGDVTVNGGTFSGERYEIDVCVEGGNVTLNRGTTLVHNGVWGNLTDQRSSIVKLYVSTQESLVSALQNGKNAVLSGNVTLTAPIEIAFGTSSSLDLNGNTLSVGLESEGRHHYAIENEGAITIRGEGTISARGIKNFGLMSVEKGVTIEAIDANGGAAIWNEGGDLIINGGTFKALHAGSSNDTYGPGCINNSKKGNVTINGGSFVSNNYRTYAIINEATAGALEINNATVLGTHGGIGINGGKVEINGGEFSCTQHYALYVSGGSVMVNGGYFKGSEIYQKDIYVDGGSVILNVCDLEHNSIHGTVTDNRILPE